MTPTTWLQVIGSALALGLTWTIWWVKKQDNKKKDQDDIDKEIDNASSITDFIHIDDELCDK